MISLHCLHSPHHEPKFGEKRCVYVYAYARACVCVRACVCAVTRVPSVRLHCRWCHHTHNTLSHCHTVTLSHSLTLTHTHSHTFATITTPKPRVFALPELDATLQSTPWRCRSCYETRYKTMCFGQNSAVRVCVVIVCVSVCECL